MKIGPVLLIAMLLFAGCSKQAPPKKFDQLKVSYKPYDKPLVERQIPIVFMFVDASMVYRTEKNQARTIYGTHYLCFGNYDLSEDPEKPNMEILKDIPPEYDLQPTKACVEINDKEGTNSASPLRPGNYFIGLSKDMLDSIAGARISWNKRTFNSQSLFQFPKMKGQLRLDSVSEDAFSGEVDLTDGENSIVGTFNGKAKIKKYIAPPIN